MVWAEVWKDTCIKSLVGVQLVIQYLGATSWWTFHACSATAELTESPESTSYMPVFLQLLGQTAHRF